MNELELIRNHFLGFHNDFFDNIRRVSTYPPYNIKENDDKGVIEFAVAGFAEKDLKVEVKENTLSIHGCKDKMTTEVQLHKHIVVDNAELKDGLLKISYHRDIPEVEKPKQIKIKST